MREYAVCQRVPDPELRECWTADCNARNNTLGGVKSKIEVVHEHLEFLEANGVSPAGDKLRGYTLLVSFPSEPSKSSASFHQKKLNK